MNTNKSKNKVIFYKEFESSIKYGYKPEHKVKTYIKITEYIDEDILSSVYIVEVPNCAFTEYSLQDALIKALEHESIGMAKYNKLKEDLYSQDLFKKLDCK